MYIFQERAAASLLHLSVIFLGLWRGDSLKQSLASWGQAMEERPVWLL